jgi:hypothetical protein
MHKEVVKTYLHPFLACLLHHKHPRTVLQKDGCLTKKRKLPLGCTKVQYSPPKLPQILEKEMAKNIQKIENFNALNLPTVVSVLQVLHSRINLAN